MMAIEKLIQPSRWGRYIGIALALTTSGCQCSPSSPLAAKSSKQIIAINESRVELKGVAIVVVPSETLENQALVTISAEESRDAMETFDQTAGVVLPSGTVKSSYVVIVNTGHKPPKKHLGISLTVPAPLMELLKSKGADIKVYAEYIEGSELELHDVFGEVDNSIDPRTGTITLSLAPWYFSEIHRADGTFETRILVAAIPQKKHK